MVTAIDGVTNVVPVPSEVPPVAAAYQLMTAPGIAVALKVTAPGPQVLPGKNALIPGCPM